MTRWVLLMEFKCKMEHFVSFWTLKCGLLWRDFCIFNIQFGGFLVPSYRFILLTKKEKLTRQWPSTLFSPLWLGLSFSFHLYHNVHYPKVWSLKDSWSTWLVCSNFISCIHKSNFLPGLGCVSPLVNSKLL